MKKSLPTLTIAVCAYNEAKNAAPFLTSLLRQDLQGLILKEILFVSDGSTDNTVAIVKKIQRNNRIVRLIQHKTRIGKSSHLNTIYRNLKTDYLVQTDADVIFEDKQAIQQIVTPMLKDKALYMTCGNPIPAPASTYLEIAHNVVYMSLCETHKPIRGGQSAFIADGRLLGYRASFIKHVKVPHDMIANDVFTYFACRARGLKARYIPEANVIFRGPQLFRDKLRQNARSSAVKLRMIRHFPTQLVEKEMHIPLSVNLKSKYNQFKRSPIMGIYMYCINIYCQIRAVWYEKNLSAVWPIAKTTKRILTIGALLTLGEAAI